MQTSPPGLSPPHRLPGIATTTARSAVRLITIHEMAALLRCSVSSLYRARRTGHIKDGIYQLPNSRVVRFDPIKILEQLRQK